MYRSQEHAHSNHAIFATLPHEIFVALICSRLALDVTFGQNF